MTNQIRIEMLVEDAVFGHLSVSDEEVGAHFEANQAFFERPETVKVSQILIDDEGLANTIATEFGGRTTRFEELAKEHSVGPEASRGGHLGSFARGELPPIARNDHFLIAAGKGLRRRRDGFRLPHFSRSRESSGSPTLSRRS